jgi:hypothetical protein
MSEKHLADKPISNGTTTTSLGTSDSSNITSASSGFAGDGSHSLFPSLKPSKGWYSKTNRTMNLDPERK